MSSLPKELLSSLSGLPGFDPAAFEQIHSSGQQVTSIRFNQAKLFADRHASGEISGGAGISGNLFPGSSNAQKIPWSSYGYYLSDRPAFTFDPLFHAGIYYVQEASSMFLEQALKQTADLSRPLRVLDLCAAPGGKSTLIQSLISKDSLLVSNEVIKSRVPVLEENLVKWGAANTIITNNDPRDFSRLENYFDLIIIDAPCSGSGLFRRDPEAIHEWSEANVQHCSQRQQRIIADAWPALKQDGLLIYSTCSYSQEEDEDILDWTMENLSASNRRLQTEPDWNIVESVSPVHKAFGYRFFPDKVKGEGFFIACLQKKDGDGFAYPKAKKNILEKLNKAEESVVKQYLKQDQRLFYFKHNDQVYAFPEEGFNDLVYLRDQLYLKKAGVLLGRISPKELIPDHELALSMIVSREIPVAGLSLTEAISYLRKEEIKTGLPFKGWALAQYREQSLGWIKKLDNRINNYYPKEWRIRSQRSGI